MACSEPLIAGLRTTAVCALVVCPGNGRGGPEPGDLLTSITGLPILACTRREVTACESFVSLAAAAPSVDEGER